MNQDNTSTIIGGGVGLLMLQSVQWEKTWPLSGETVKAIVALLLIPLGYMMYHNRKGAA